MLRDRFLQLSVAVSTVLVFATLGLGDPSASPPAREPSRPEGPRATPTAIEIDRWIGQLSATQFARREAASRSLLEAGQPALDPLEQAITDGEDFEVSSRGVEIVRGMLESDDSELASAAEELLERCAERGGEPVGRLASAVLGFHFLGREQAARERLESLGAGVVQRPAAPGRQGLEVEFGAAWIGSTADLRQLARLRGLAAVSFHGIVVDSDAVAVLGRLRGVRRIDLYGTGLGERDAATLAAQLPDTVVDVRKGGKLGVSSLGVGGPCEITHVQPDSAAARAGVRIGDVIVAVDGEPIAGFDGLTERVGRRGAGEPLVLTIDRPSSEAVPERIECVARLDAW
jgi:hypothetical protein